VFRLENMFTAFNNRNLRRGEVIKTHLADTDDRQSRPAEVLKILKNERFY
jgi:hypothetical protein